MRIVGGALKGRRLKAPSSIPARPTTDFAKESLFNILHHRLDWAETEMLDLFAGIGSMSLEAGSRGAKRVLSIDLHHQAVKWISRAAKELGLDQVQAFRADALKWLERNEDRYDLVFADPPYDFAHYDALIKQVMQSALETEGLFILEHRKSGSFSEHPNFAFDRTYGEVRFTFFEHSVT